MNQQQFTNRFSLRISFLKPEIFVCFKIGKAEGLSLSFVSFPGFRLPEFSATLLKMQGSVANLLCYPA
jgi:hypothetical protein